MTVQYGKNLYSRQLGPYWSIFVLFSKKIILLVFLQQYSLERNSAFSNFTLRRHGPGRVVGIGTA